MYKQQQHQQTDKEVYIHTGDRIYNERTTAHRYFNLKNWSIDLTSQSIGKRPDENSDEKMPVRHVDVGVELHVHGGLGDKGYEREAQLRQDHHQVRYVPSTTPHYPSRPMNPTNLRAIFAF
jgi:hypothetical protein